MADHVITLASGQLGAAPDSTGLIFEDVQVVGDGVGTSGVYRTQFVKRPERVLGDFAATFSGRQVTLASAAFSGTRWARILGLA